MSKIIAIIQARVGSTRLPGKVLLKIEGRPVLEHVVRRVRKSKFIDKVLLATTHQPADKKIVKLCRYLHLSVFCGSENNVLDRYYQLAQKIKPCHIVRVTADCPLIDAKIIDRVIKAHLKSKSDYTTNTLEPTFPDGEDIEIFTFSTLRKAWEEASLPSEKEHVTPFIRNHPRLFQLKNIRSKIDHHDKRWTLDEPTDFIFIKKIFHHLYRQNHYFGMPEILHLLKSHPQLAKINDKIIRNEGYIKSLRQDQRTIKPTVIK